SSGAVQLGANERRFNAGDRRKRGLGSWHSCRYRGDSGAGDRKSTRLNSSHVAISYAVFCLKKKRSSHNKLSSCLSKPVSSLSHNSSAACLKKTARQLSTPSKRFTATRR